jgi:hypothetical protein
MPCKKHLRKLTSMDDILVVQIVHRLEYLLDRLGCILFCELALVADSIEEFSSCGKLGDDVVLILSRISIRPNVRL